MPDTLRPCTRCNGSGTEPEVTVRFPQNATCDACARAVVVAESRDRDGFALMFDPEPDGDGEHYDTVLAEDLSIVRGSGDATAIDCKGRFPLYRSHFWSCPERLRVADRIYGTWSPVPVPPSR